MVNGPSGKEDPEKVAADLKAEGEKAAADLKAKIAKRSSGTSKRTD